MVTGAVAGGVGDMLGRCIGDEVKAGELAWVRLIYMHDCLFWFLQNIHDGFLLDLCCRGKGKGPIAGPGGGWLFTRVGLANGSDMIGSRI
jgi:hypothetical protein